MGYYIFSYGIRTTEIEKVFNSKDHKLLHEIEDNPVFQNYADFEVSGLATTPAKALVDIVDGRPYDNKSNYAYGYAVIGICATLGEELPYGQEIKLGYETDLINKVLTEDFGVHDFNIEGTLLPDNSNPFAIPPIDDWPLIGLVRHEQLGDLKRGLESLNITDEMIEEMEDDPEEKGFMYEHIQGIRQNVNYCYENGLDIVSFCH